MSVISKINRKIDENRFNYYGVKSGSILLGSCVASGAVMAILTNDASMWQLYLICCVAMASNAASISHSPMRWVVWTFIINLILSLVLIVVNLF